MAEQEPLSVGDEAPAFTAPLVWPEGNVEDTSLSSLLEDGPVLLVFYTADFSPDCIEEWCAFRDFSWFASSEDVQVVGISKSGPKMHKRFISRLNLSFPMFSDTDLEVAEKFGVKYRALKISSRARRSCFLIDTDRTIKYRWVAEHWLDPTRDVPPVQEIYENVQDALGLAASEA